MALMLPDGSSNVSWFAELADLLDQTSGSLIPHNRIRASVPVRDAGKIPLPGTSDDKMLARDILQS